MSYKSKNKATIKRAFSRFRSISEDAIRNGMVNIARTGLLFLVDAHEMFNIQELHNHLNEDNTLAWAVAHNGSIIESGDLLGGGSDMPGNAELEARNLLGGTTGWVAVIYSDMKGWYRADWEEEYLNYSRDMIASDFYSIFTQVN
jgi:hypothetical protein